ncbi:hypothetical protein NEPAR06_0969 [Nematocida parisii]|uniref:MHD domain-containing protein n=1 Tax=Nematocida parisii (strain ERTm3) TaxID=935791 RepID=I3EH71_NEMP3|nr:uncharacterized protein NEPG_00342 [Nematocida parisii ERTm1]EIJ88568.1 hypothetical protein NEQG_01258 [Nematocida parisii ERTm3]KAI5129915.1 hypothetical protein NEPAR03_1885 [Nematocida parisii]EIJ94818.1 hypothetical protein NEPG_00342 [Nematocida parisii ERTm1]KAI5130143.1 hypothetical protein NEPAR08_1881 [Nematocida parisii]KAI5143934.1 hypothetical protein NEPAR04_2015 [Nematocida parisii]|eukprot:XP_013058174.1 hypothetical protein NEPG_00342 [Nematocida parisii ERTm1]
MFTKVEIETSEGTALLTYTSPLHIYDSKKGPIFSLSQKFGSLTFKGVFLNSEDQLIAKHILYSMVSDLAIGSDIQLLKKHATIYAYIDNYLTSRNLAFPIPRRKSSNSTAPSSALAPKKKVFVEVADKVFLRLSQGRTISSCYGQISTNPSEDVGQMSLKIDSRSLCGLRNIQYDSSVCRHREGITTLLTCPSKNSTIMTYTYAGSISDLPMVKAVLVDTKTIEILLCFTPDKYPDMFSTSLVFDYTIGNISVQCKEGEYEYHAPSRKLTWKLSKITRNASLTIHTTESHRASAVIKYMCKYGKTAVSSVVVKSLSSDADENWIKHTTDVSGLLRLQE